MASTVADIPMQHNWFTQLSLGLFSMESSDLWREFWIGLAGLTFFLLREVGKTASTTVRNQSTANREMIATIQADISALRQQNKDQASQIGQAYAELRQLEGKRQDDVILMNQLMLENALLRIVEKSLRALCAAALKDLGKTPDQIAGMLPEPVQKTKVDDGN